MCLPFGFIIVWHFPSFVEETNQVRAKICAHCSRGWEKKKKCCTWTWVHTWLRVNYMAFFFLLYGWGGGGKLNVWKWMKESVWKKKGQVRINELDAAVLEKRSAMLPWTHRTPRWPLPVCCAHPKSASPSQLFSLLPLPRHSAAVPDPLEGQRWRRKRQEKQVRPTEREWEGGVETERQGHKTGEDRQKTKRKYDQEWRDTNTEWRREKGKKKSFFFFLMFADTIQNQRI